MAHPDRLDAIETAEQAVGGVEPDARRAVLALAGRQDVAAELARHELRAVADTEDGDATAPYRRVGFRGRLVVHRHRAAGQDDRARPAPFEFGIRRVVRQELGIDVELANPSGDQLGELAPEIEDDHRTGGRRGGIAGRAVRRGGVERCLEICLDLGVIGGEDAVTGVRRLPVDGLATITLGPG